MAIKILMLILIVAGAIGLYQLVIFFFSAKKDKEPHFKETLKQAAKQISSHKFVEPDHLCCSRFQEKNISDNAKFDSVVLAMVEQSSLFEDMSLDGQSSWINLYRCTQCQMVWELASPSHGQPGHFRPLERPI